MDPSGRRHGTSRVPRAVGLANDALSALTGRVAGPLGPWHLPPTATGSCSHLWEPLGRPGPEMGRGQLGPTGVCFVLPALRSQTPGVCSCGSLAFSPLSGGPWRGTGRVAGTQVCGRAAQSAGVALPGHPASSRQSRKLLQAAVVARTQVSAPPASPHTSELLHPRRGCSPGQRPS